MKKFILILTLIFIGLVSYAQKDTVVLKTSIPLQFDQETSINKAGKTREEYFVTYKDVIYITDKTSYKRSKLYDRFDVLPIYAIVLDEKTKAAKIIIL